MPTQEKLTDMGGYSPELSFYNYTPSGDYKMLVFQDNDGFWKARHHVRGDIVNMKLSQVYFEKCKRVSDEEIAIFIKESQKTISCLQEDIEVKEGKEELSRLEAAANSSD